MALAREARTRGRARDGKRFGITRAKAGEVEMMKVIGREEDARLPVLLDSLEGVGADPSRAMNERAPRGEGNDEHVPAPPIVGDLFQTMHGAHGDPPEISSCGASWLC